MLSAIIAAMKAFFKFLPTLMDRVIWMVGLCTIMIYAMDHWPTAFWITLGAILLGLGGWYVWKFVVQPFRAGLKGE